MAKSKKRSADSSANAATRPSKKRKSAEAALVKLQEIKDADEALSEIEEMYDRGMAYNEEGAEGVESEDDSPEGFKKWKTTTMLVSGKPLGEEVATVNNRTWQFTQAVEIHNKEAFTLRPLILTEGSLKGHHVLVLQPVQKKSKKATVPFRFLDLPAELRVNIIEIAFNETGVIPLTTYKPPHQQRRPVRRSFRSPYGRRRSNAQWDKLKGKWIGQQPSALTILGVCKSVLEEAAPIIYCNTFEFSSTSDLGHFLTQIGSMAQYLKAIRLDCLYGWGYAASKAASVFRKLQPAVRLQRIWINDRHIRDEPSPDGHRYWYSRRPSVGIITSDMSSLVKAIHKAQTRYNSSYSVLSLVQVETDHCFGCKERGKPKAARSSIYTGHEPCSLECKRSAKTSAQKTKQFRRLIAEMLHIEDQESDDEETVFESAAVGQAVEPDNESDYSAW